MAQQAWWHSSADSSADSAPDAARTEINNVKLSSVLVQRALLNFAEIETELNITAEATTATATGSPAARTMLVPGLSGSLHLHIILTLCGLCVETLLLCTDASAVSCPPPSCLQVAAKHHSKGLAAPLPRFRADPEPSFLLKVPRACSFYAMPWMRFTASIPSNTLF